ncbi:MAG: peptidase M15A, partial [Alphaproteobacteria bacterium]|nr:peptidase M15A [Alphaproteobacteria bacterium]
MTNRLLTKHFSLAELTRSAIALRHGLRNSPSPQEILSLTRLAENILEPVRQNFGLAFSPSSGYRAPEVNRLAGSKPTSRHIFGEAADFEIAATPNRDLADWIKANLIFDQLILEFYHHETP